MFSNVQSVVIFIKMKTIATLSSSSGSRSNLPVGATCHIGVFHINVNCASASALQMVWVQVGKGVLDQIAYSAEPCDSDPRSGGQESVADLVESLSRKPQLPPHMPLCDITNLKAYATAPGDHSRAIASSEHSSSEQPFFHVLAYSPGLVGHLLLTYVPSSKVMLLFPLHIASSLDAFPPPWPCPSASWQAEVLYCHFHHLCLNGRKVGMTMS